MRSVIVLVIFSVLLLAGGLYAWMSAPPGASAATALIVPGACAAVMLCCAAVIGATRRRSLATARRAHLVAVVLSLVFAGAFAHRASRANAASISFDQTRFRYESAVADGAIADTPENRAEFFRAQDAPDHDKRYLANTLWILTVAGAGAFIALLVTRPGNRGPVFTGAPRERGDAER